MDSTDFALRGVHITLDALLKASGIAGGGGAAKVLIADDGRIAAQLGCTAIVNVASAAWLCESARPRSNEQKTLASKSILTPPPAGITTVRLKTVGG